MLQKIKVRMKLSDFINTEHEEKIMNKYSEVNNNYHVASMLYLWFEDGDDITTLKEFISRWEKKLSIQTKIKNSSSISKNDWLFFDIKPTSLPTSRARFTFSYSDSKQILDGLCELDKILKFITEDKPTKTQKRNDYED
tara:strand:+ start:659 stop:1075 length:417 start_codon:yes stop_codon:yes gene_type:complete